MTATKMSNATARRHFLHAHDENHDTGERCCYFSERAWDESGWGIWIDRHGNVDIDTVSANGEEPSPSVLRQLITAAKKYLAH